MLLANPCPQALSHPRPEAGIRAGAASGVPHRLKPTHASKGAVLPLGPSTTLGSSAPRHSCLDAAGNRQPPNRQSRPHAAAGGTCWLPPNPPHTGCTYGANRPPTFNRLVPHHQRLVLLTKCEQM